MLGVSSCPVVSFLAVVWPMISVFLALWGPLTYQVTLGVTALGCGGLHVHQVTLGILALGCGFPHIEHLQFGSLFHPLHLLHHP